MDAVADVGYLSHVVHEHLQPIVENIKILANKKTNIHLLYFLQLLLAVLVRVDGVH